MFRTFCRPHNKHRTNKSKHTVLHESTLMQKPSVHAYHHHTIFAYFLIIVKLVAYFMQIPSFVLNFGFTEFSFRQTFVDCVSNQYKYFDVLTLH